MPKSPARVSASQFTERPEQSARHSSPVVTLKDVARAAGVNVSTVSRALAGVYGIRKETRERVMAIAESLNYHPNLLARGLITGRSHTIGMLLSDIRNPFFTEFARGAEDAAYAAGFDIILCNSDLGAGKQIQYLRSLQEKRVAGIVMNSVSNLSPELEDELAEWDTPIVLLNRPFVQGKFSTVTADNYQGGLLAGTYLTNLGHRDLAHLTGPTKHGNLSQRSKGFLKAVTASGARCQVIHGENSYQGGYRIAKKLLAQTLNVTAIFAANDAMAFGVLRAAMEEGLNVPLDVSLMGFDNVEFSALAGPPLTTINQPRYEAGRAAVEILLKQANSPDTVSEHRVFEVQLIERKSCRKL